MIKFFTKLDFAIVELLKIDIFLISLEKGAERYFYFLREKDICPFWPGILYVCSIAHKKKNVRTRVMCGVKGDKLKNTQDTHVSATWLAIDWSATVQDPI